MISLTPTLIEISKNVMKLGYGCCLQVSMKRKNKRGTEVVYVAGSVVLAVAFPSS